MTSIIEADFTNPHHAAALIELMNVYSNDLMGGGSALSEHTITHLASEMAQRDTLFSFIAFNGENPVGLANCIESFSTFACKPLVNIHDLVVKGEFRGQGIAQALLRAVEQEALHRGCCKLTLEVLDRNHPAKQLYQKLGFGPYSFSPKQASEPCDPTTGQALFWQKSLT